MAQGSGPIAYQVLAFLNGVRDDVMASQTAFRATVDPSLADADRLFSVLMAVLASIKADPPTPLPAYIRVTFSRAPGTQTLDTLNNQLQHRLGDTASFSPEINAGEAQQILTTIDQMAAVQPRELTRLKQQLANLPAIDVNGRQTNLVIGGAEAFIGENANALGLNSTRIAVDRGQRVSMGFVNLNPVAQGGDRVSALHNELWEAVNRMEGDDGVLAASTQWTTATMSHLSTLDISALAGESASEAVARVVGEVLPKFVQAYGSTAHPGEIAVGPDDIHQVVDMLKQTLNDLLVRVDGVPMALGEAVGLGISLNQQLGGYVISLQPSAAPITSG